MICTPHQIFSGDEIKKNKLGRACSAYGERRGVYKGLVGNSKGKRPHERPRRRWEDNIKIDLQEVGWIELAQDMERWRALVNAVMNLGIP